MDTKERLAKIRNQQNARRIAGCFWESPRATNDRGECCGNCDQFGDPCHDDDWLGEACEYWTEGLPLV